jgi:hypothetical protein
MKSTMPLSNPSVTQIAQVISEVTAPAILLGFTSVLISRTNRIIDRSQALNAGRQPDQGAVKIRYSAPKAACYTLEKSHSLFHRHRNRYVIGGYRRLYKRLL